MNSLNNLLTESIFSSLKPYIKEESIIVRSPGRINLIGEHTDYNQGFVLPAAINKNAYVVVTPRNDSMIKLIGYDMKEEYITSVNDIHINKNASWTNYLLGVMAQFKKAGFEIPGFEVVLTSNIPSGAGLSSSAAIECAMCFALNELLQAGLDKRTMAKMAQTAEHEYAGVQCGIMDQFASLFGKKNHVIQLDCRSLEFELIPMELNEYNIILLDTGVKHQLANSAYNERRAQCEAGVDLIKNKYSEVNSLRDVNMSMLIQYVQPVDETIFQRCKYVIEENVRLLNGINDLRNGCINEFGIKMFSTHDGLKNEYEVSCKELDYLVDNAKSHPAVIGARMMGGGFGGCTINLVKKSLTEDFITDVTSKYSIAMEKQLESYVVSIEDGSSVISS